MVSPSQKIYEVMDMLSNKMGESFYNVYIYQITTVCTFNILQFYISVINILKKNYLRHSGHFYIV